MRLPLLLSVPHAGREVPEEVRRYCILTPEQIIKDGDEGAEEIYDLRDEVKAYVTTTVPRAILDMNRAEDDRRKDGIVKTHTCWDEPIYDPSPPEEAIARLLDRHYRPYHRRLTEMAATGVRLGVDCHTMATAGPPVGPDAGRERPALCLGTADGTCPDDWIPVVRERLEQAFGVEVSLNHPFTGGFIIRHHAAELPWIQLELSRGAFLEIHEKRRRTLQAFQEICRRLFPGAR
jgi:N-formylglutamate amidohydrolase